jgi:hypothetical protein
MSPDQQARVVNDLRAQLNAQAPFLGIDAPEDFSEQNSINDLNAYTNGALGNAALVTTHTYSANNPGGLSSAAVSSGKSLLVSEYGDGDATGLSMAQRIHDDITGMGARAWVYWQVVDNAGGWGFLYNPLVAATNSSFTTSYTINQKFYVMGQFSEFVRPGYNVISVNDNYTLAAYNPTNSTLALVIVNTNTSSFNVTYNLNAFTSLPSQVSVSQTAGNLGENLATLPSLAVVGGQFTSAIPAQSVTTFVLTNVTLMPLLVTQGASSAATNFLTLYTGATPQLFVSALGSEPFFYQWFSNGVVLGGATNPAYTPPVAAQGSSSIYDCIVSNVAGSVTSTVWSVSILAPPAAPYPQAVLALHPTGYWRLNEQPNNGNGNQGVVCHDYVGGNDGVYSNAVLAQTGYNPVTDPTETATFFGSYLSTNSAASQIGNIDFSAPSNENAELSVAAWVKGNAQTVDAGIVSKGYGSGGEQFNLDTGSDSLATHGFRFLVRDAFGNTAAANSTNMPDGNWHFLSGVCDEANGAVHLYVDGVDKADGSIRPGMALLEAGNGSAPGSSLISIGSRSGSISSTGFTNQFVGTINDVAIYSYALSPGQVAAEYQAAEQLVPAITSQLPLPYTNLFTLYAGVSPTFVISAPGALSYQWFTNAHAVADATNAGFTLPNVQIGLFTNYCVVTNYVGAATSMVWTASVIADPTNAFSQTVLGNNPVAYWRLNEPADSKIANDYAGGASSLYGANTTNGLPGVPFTTFGNEFAVAMDNNASSVGAGCVTNAGIILNTNTLTFLCWVFPFTNQFNPSGLVFCRSGSSVAGSQIGGAEALDYTWGNNSATYDYGSGLTVPTNMWSLVALTTTSSNAVLYVLNTNGIGSATNNVANPVQSFNAGLALGADTLSSTRIFNGRMDEAAIFNYPLSTALLTALFSAATNNLPQISSNPTNLVFTVTNNELSLSWPADHLGWTLQAQTNSLSIGLSANWVNVSGSTATNQLVFPINLTNGTVFYRLFYQVP